MKLTSLATAVALTASRAAAADESVLTLNFTDASSPTRHLQEMRIFKMQGVDVVAKDIHDQQGKSVIECFGRHYGKSYGGQVSTAFVWTNYQTGWCWVKATDYHGTPTTPKAEADTIILLKDSTSEFIWSGTKNGFDMAGFDIDNKPGADMGACFNRCNDNKACFAVTWTDYNGGTCWLKSRASGFVAKAGAKTAYVARPFSIWGAPE